MADVTHWSADSHCCERPPTVREIYRGRDFSVRTYICRCGPGDPPFDEIHAQTCLGAVLSGFFSYRTDHSACALSPGAILLGNKGQAYQCSHEHSRGDVNLVFAIGDGMLAAVGDRDREFRRPCLPPSPDLSITIGRAEAAAAAADGFWLEEIAYALLSSALSERRFEEPPPSPKDMERASQVIRFIEGNYASHLTLGQLADIAALSPFHFVRSFRAVTGSTPYHYVVQLRLRDAAARLLRSDLPVTDIAFGVGFGDLSQFIRTFRAASGLTPGAFRAAYS